MGVWSEGEGKAGTWAHSLRAAGASGRRARWPTLDGDARVVGVRFAPRRLVQDGFCQLRKCAVDVDIRLRRRLHEADAMLARYLQARKLFIV